MPSYSMLRRKLAKKTLLDMYRNELPQVGYPGGKVFFIDGVDGSDSGAGDVVDDPYKTITYALTKCTDRADDIILVKRMNLGAEADYPIDVNKRKVHIIAQNSTGLFGPADPPAINYSGDSAGFIVTANYVEIAGFDIGGYSTNAGIETGSLAGVWGTCIHDCIFGFRSCDSQDGIKVAATYDAPYLWVYDCIFGSTLDRDGIRLDGTATRGFLGLPGHGNYFDEVTGVGIHAPAALATPVLAGIFDNVFALPSDTAGKAISILGTGGTKALVDGNSAMYGTSAMTTNPYRDLGGFHWGFNTRQGVSILPATV